MIARNGTTAPDTCPCCGGETVSLPGLPETLQKLGMSEQEMAYAAGVDEVLVRAASKRPISQDLCRRIMEVVREKLAARR